MAKKKLTEYDRGREDGIKEIWEKMPHDILEVGLATLSTMYTGPKDDRQRHHNELAVADFITKTTSQLHQVNDVLWEYKPLVAPFMGLDAFLDDKK